MDKNLARRQFLQKSLGLGATLGAAALSFGPAVGRAAELCAPTVEQTEGPFYPGEDKMLPINDLTRVEGATGPALGQIIFVEGIVRDLNCVPVANANVEIWQACASGRYNHDQDSNPAPLDPNFRYWGETFTDANGAYTFKSIMPGAYPADTEWDRPPHIHFRVIKKGYLELTTQMYFKGHPLNDEDKIIARIPKEARQDVFVDFTLNPKDITSLSGHFNISIEKI